MMLWPVVFAICGVCLVAGCHYLLYFSVADNLESAIWGSLFMAFVAYVFISSVQAFFRRSYKVFVAFNFAAILSLPCYLLISYIAGLGPFSDLDPVTGRSDRHWIHSLWLYGIGIFICLSIYAIISSRLRKFTKNQWKKQQIAHVVSVLFHIVMIGFVAGVAFSASYFAQQEETVVTILLENVIVGLMYVVIRIALRSSFSRVVVNLGNSNKTQKESESEENKKQIV